MLDKRDDDCGRVAEGGPWNNRRDKYRFRTDCGQCESSLADRRRGRGADPEKSESGEGVEHATRSRLWEAVCDVKRSREGLRKADGGVCMEYVRGDELLFSSVRTSKTLGKDVNSPAAVTQTRSRRRGEP